MSDGRVLVEVAGDGGAWLLPRAVGSAKAAEALACGLVSRAAPDASCRTRRGPTAPWA